MRKHAPVDVDAAVTRLAGQVDRIQHDVLDIPRLRADIEAHSRTLADLAELIRRLRTAGAPTGASAIEADEENEPAPEWLTVDDPELAVRWLADLDQWTRDVWMRYQQLPPCWPWHPSVVAELLVCQHLWANAAMPGSGPDALAAWHDRWRPGAAHRTTRVMAACERAGGFHVAQTGARWAVDQTVLDELALWWATTHGSTPPPGLIGEDHA